MSLLRAVKCYPCRKVYLNYIRSLLFHGGYPDQSGFDSRTGRQYISIHSYRFQFDEAKQFPLSMIQRQARRTSQATKLKVSYLTTG